MGSSNVDRTIAQIEASAANSALGGNPHTGPSTPTGHAAGGGKK